jgi:hypothetical protein
MYSFNDLESLIDVKSVYSKTPFLARKTKARAKTQDITTSTQEAITPIRPDSQLDQPSADEQRLRQRKTATGTIPGWQENNKTVNESIPSVEERSSTVIKDKLPITTAPADATGTSTSQGLSSAAPSTGESAGVDRRAIKKQVEQQWDPVFKRLHDFKESLRQLDVRQRDEAELSRLLDELNALSRELRPPTSRALPDADRSKANAKRSATKRRGAGDPLSFIYDEYSGQLLVPAVDQFGDPILDENGDPIMMPVQDLPPTSSGDDSQVTHGTAAIPQRLSVDEIYRQPGLSWDDAVRLAKDDPALTIAGEALLSFYVGTRKFAIPSPPRDFYVSFINPLAQHVTRKLYLPLDYSIALIIAITHGESGYGRRTRNPDSNAQGYIQMIPGTRAGLRQIFGLPEWDEERSKDDLQMNLIYSQAYFTRLSERLKNLGIRQKIRREADGTPRGEIEITAPLINKEAIIAAMQNFPVMTNGNDFRLLLIIIFHAVGLGVSDMITRRDALISRFLVCKHIQTALELREMGISVPIFRGTSRKNVDKRTQAGERSERRSPNTRNTPTDQGNRTKDRNAGNSPTKNKQKRNRRVPTTGGSSGDPFLVYQNLFY